MRRELGKHPGVGEVIYLGHSRYGSFLQMGNAPETCRLLSTTGYVSDAIDIELAVEMFDRTDQAAERRWRRSAEGSFGYASDSSLDIMDVDFLAETGVFRQDFVDALVGIGRRECFNDPKRDRYALDCFMSGSSVGLADIRWWARIAGTLDRKSLLSLFRGLVLCEQKRPRASGGSIPSTPKVLRFIKDRIDCLELADLLEWTEKNRGNSHTPFGSDCSSLRGHIYKLREARGLAAELGKFERWTGAIERRLGADPASGESVLVVVPVSGEPFFQTRSSSIRLSPTMDPDTVSLEEAVEFVNPEKLDLATRSALKEWNESFGKWQRMERIRQERLARTDSHREISAFNRKVRRKRIERLESLSPEARIEDALDRSNFPIWTLPVELFDPSVIKPGLHRDCLIHTLLPLKGKWRKLLRNLVERRARGKYLDGPPMPPRLHDGDHVDVYGVDMAVRWPREIQDHFPEHLPEIARLLHLEIERVPLAILRKSSVRFGSERISFWAFLHEASGFWLVNPIIRGRFGWPVPGGPHILKNGGWDIDMGEEDQAPHIKEDNVEFAWDLLSPLPDTETPSS